MGKAIVEIGTGVVMNVVELEPDNNGTYISWQCPEGYEIKDIDESTGPAERGGIYDNETQTYSLAPPRVLSRVEVLMHTPTGSLEADEIEALNVELLGLLHDKLNDTGNLSWEEMNKMLVLERKS
jgi:hypothetical protein